jgi:hypothetical protein
MKKKWASMTHIVKQYKQILTAEIVMRYVEQLEL